ncbi:MAG: trypsin-like serine protease [Candidatus Pacebacteria bacterium]|jgi:serine protease Do|nr:trypsin-like serine protease [Candidatus Paceibacterota bacterium]MBT4005306.1 trypsin-like serine protease [Candidatus Paceibacterota bacterium]MBT6898662.1 trypsin-like serine protease [Candidatus Paceibacterota bacterium]MBT7499930.1 trypsin-like serine protease [Candidatus Paceibacterota bacterium]
MKITPQIKTFSLGLSVSILVLVSFFAGAISDRVFVIKPINLLTNKSSSQVQPQQTEVTKLATLVSQPASIADVAEVASESVVTILVRRKEDAFEFQRDIGTGFVVREDGLVVTNKHVVSDDKAEYLIVDKNSKEYSILEIYHDPKHDLALIKIDKFSASAPLLLADSAHLRVGEEVIAIGTALGEFRHTVTTGVIAGLGRSVQSIDAGSKKVEDLTGLIQTDAAVNPGNSGGPLLDRIGQVIGVNVGVAVGLENMSFALPINLVKELVDTYESGVIPQ